MQNHDIVFFRNKVGDCIAISNNSEGICTGHVALCGHADSLHWHRRVRDVILRSCG
jgi:hypothetical protein